MKKIIFLMLLFVMSIVVMPNVYAADNEAKVEEKLYSLEQAIEQVKTTGGTIELQDNVKLSNILEISVEKPITIQLNEHNIESEQDITIVVRKGEVTFSKTLNQEVSMELYM